MMDGIVRDLTSGCKVLLRRPGFTLMALITLATGIAASCAVFSVVESVLLRPLPYVDADRLVIPRTQNKSTGNRYNITWPDYTMWREEGVFEAVAMFDPISIDLTGDGEPARARAMLVGDGYFEVVRKAALLGRIFLPEDHRPGAQRTLLLGEGFWRSRYGADPEALGRIARVDDVAHTVVGVVPDEAAAPYAIDVWVPRQPDPADENLKDWDNHAFTAIARLKVGETLDSTNAALAVLAARVEEEHPGLRAGETSIAVPLIRHLTGTDLNRALWILLGTAGFVLLIGCLNVANLLLTLAAHRGREIAVRTALGAGRLRLIRGELALGLLLSIGGGAAGLMLSLWLVDLLIALAPQGIPRIADVHLNGPVVAFAVALSILSAGASSLVPALRAAGSQPASALNEATFRTTAGRRAGKSRSLLIGLEVALSLILLAGAGFTLRSLWNLSQAETGFEQERLLRVPIALPRTRYQPGQPVIGFYEKLLQEVETIPGVHSATLRSAMPIGGGGFYVSRSYLLEGRPEPPVGAEIQGPWTVVTPGHFRTMGIPILKGRDFEPFDDEGGNPVLIVNQRFVEEMFGGEEPLGKRVRSWRDENIYREIVGVVGNERYFQVGDSIRPCVYVPHRQDRWRAMSLVIRSSGNPAALIPSVRAAVSKQDPELILADISTMNDAFAANLAPSRFLSTLMGVFAIIALILSAVGIYGVLSYLISQRTREIGVRMAMGADQAGILRMLIRQSLPPVSMGMLAGLAGAFALGRLLQSLLFEVSLAEALPLAAACSILAGAAAVALLVPAARAAAMGPVDALRMDL